MSQESPPSRNSPPPEIPPPPPGPEPESANAWRPGLSRSTILANPFGRSSALLKLIGGIEILVFGFISMVMIWSGTRSADQLQQSLQIELAEDLPGAMMMFGIGTLLMGVLPGVLYLLARLPVSRGHRGAIFACMILTSAQMIVLGFATFTSASNAIAAGSPLLVSLCVIFLGTPLGILIWTQRWLFSASLLAKHIEEKGYRQQYEVLLQSLANETKKPIDPEHSSAQTEVDDEPGNHPPK